MTPAHVVEVVRKALEGGKTLPRIVLLHVTQLYHHAVGNAICSSNPCRDIRESAVVGKQNAPLQRTALSAAELAAFLPALATIPRPYALAVRLLLLTGVRVGTLTEARIDESDLRRVCGKYPMNDARIAAIRQDHLILLCPQRRCSGRVSLFNWLMVTHTCCQWNHAAIAMHAIA